MRQSSRAVHIVYVIESAAYGVVFTSCLCENPNEQGTGEWGLFTQTTSEYNPLSTKQFLWRDLFITRKTRIFIEIVFLTQIKNKTHALGAENWRLTSRELLHQYFQSLSARSLNLKFFLSNDTSLWDFLNVSLFSWCYTNSSGYQPTDTNLQLYSAFEGKIWRRRRYKSRQIWKAIWM